MNIWIIALIILILGTIIYLSRSGSDEAQTRKKYVQSLAHFLDGKMDAPGEADSFLRVGFRHEGRDFMYEDFEDRSMVNDVYRHGILKIPTTSRLTLNFTEKVRGTIRTNIQSVEGLSSGWAQKTGDVVLPPAISEFSVYTNNSPLASRLLADEAVIKVFAKYKNRGTRGHPVMSLEITAGEVFLKFHSSASIQPNLMDLQANVTTVEQYLDDLLELARKLEEIERKN